MSFVIIILKIVVALSILNVWLVQQNKPTKWRGGAAKTIKEEFKVYGLPDWSCYLIGALKVLLAIGLLLSVWFTNIEKEMSIGLALLLTSSVLMHIKIKDPLYKSFPATLFLIMCLLIIYL